MSESSRARYYGAMVASFVSMFAWLGVAGGVLYTGYLLATGGAALQGGQLTLVAFLVAAGFAIVEGRLYRMDE